ncbi:hypothetical protein [Myxacorys almedinensis]|uniref:Chromosome segregation ATPase n=1 Tax=Myxacorys almedinensis A TaxID=2690445 RepID=A0A8J8CJA9_9CYAN|nr:hypothetical protein [Myxacorys almedinensis]NDJ18469.1 hypothetical protein [Myxacorys almedinensis A]
MARKITPRPWLPFQKPTSDVENHPDQPSADVENHPDRPSALSSVISDDPDVPPPGKPTKSPAAVMAQAASIRSRKMVKQLRPWAAQWKWQLICLAILSAIGGTGIGAFIWLSKAPPAVDCKKISAWSVDSERLFCAQEAAATGKPEELLNAIALAKNWTPDDPLYGQAQLLLQDWSNALLIVARDRVFQRDIKGGVALARQIPATSPIYKEAQAAIVRWQEEFNKGQVLFTKIQTELKKQSWDKASQNLAELSLNTDPSWQDRIPEIRQQINTEKLAAKLFQDAQTFAKANPPGQLGRAIAIADPIDRKTYVWTLKAQAEVTKWRNTIFSLALAELDKPNIAGASALVNSIPKSVQLTSANVDFVRLVRGTEADTSKDFSAPSLEKAAPLLLAVQLVRQIDSKSPFYSRAKTLLPRLETKLQDVVALTWSGALANMQQVPTLKMAVNQAKLIKPERPSRLYAQTLLAQWQKELQWMEDRPVLKQARQVATSGKIEPLRAAIALAGVIQPKRALRQEAQTDIADWTAQIQVIEDTPIINEATAIARSGRLGQAIDTAAKIRPGRALYGEAQTLISGWVYEIRLTEDRSTIAQANRLASIGSLTRAIDLASTIYAGRPLYGEARSLISQWAVERAEIWRQREQYVPPNNSSPDSYESSEESEDDSRENSDDDSAERSPEPTPSSPDDAPPPP